MGELDHLKVYGETRVGWCAATPTNESADENGAPVFHQTGFGAGDPRAPARRIHDDPQVCQLRERLSQFNGIVGLEIVQPQEIERAARIFFRDGFVVVRDLIDPVHVETLRAASARVLAKILDVPGPGGRKYATETRRLPHRYSYGTASASRQLLHDPVWAALVDLPATTPLLTRLFGSDRYWLTGAGGDVCLPGAIEYQTLHGDMRETFELPPGRLAQARLLGVDIGDDQSADGVGHAARQLALERTAPRITINFLLTDQTWENGPIRQIAGTQARPGPPPSPAEEPDWMRFSTIVGAPAGAGIFRDLRAWHGGTPNVSREIRAMPNVEFAAPWVEGSLFAPCMPHEIWSTLSPHAQRVSGRVKTEPGVWPLGAGVMHPYHAQRQAAKASGR